jgi:hypothetical protein
MFSSKSRLPVFPFNLNSSQPKRGENQRQINTYLATKVSRMRKWNRRVSSLRRVSSCCILSDAGTSLLSFTETNEESLCVEMSFSSSSYSHARPLRTDSWEGRKTRRMGVAMMKKRTDLHFFYSLFFSFVSTLLPVRLIFISFFFFTARWFRILSRGSRSTSQSQNCPRCQLP